jgi:hypothetical protein
MWLAVALSARAGSVDCERFGEVSPPEATFDFGGTPAEFAIVGAGTCGDAADCTWRVDGDLGTIQPARGPLVEYTPPAVPGNCIDTELQLRVKCTSASGNAILSLRCPNRFSAEGLEPSGGGCGSPSWALAFLPLAWLRRREPAVGVHRDLPAHR